jgi:Tol biopolymer transport system component
LKQIIPCILGLAVCGCNWVDMVSQNEAGEPANDQAGWAELSDDGRLVAFTSPATNLVPGDTNEVWDVFVRDLRDGTTERTSLDSSGVEGNGDSLSLSLSGNGRYIAFTSEATNLVANDFNASDDVFVHDRETGITTRVSVDSEGLEGNGDSEYPTLSADGRYVAYHSVATNLVDNDNNGFEDVFVHDRHTGITSRASVDSAENEASGDSSHPSFSADGQRLAFQSAAPDLVAADNNGTYDIFLRDLGDGTTSRLSVSSAGAEASGDSYFPSISADGQHIAFESRAEGLHAGESSRYRDIFVRDLVAGTTTRVNVHSDGTAANQSSGITFSSAISGDGRYVTFNSGATNLIPLDQNNRGDVFVHDRNTGRTERVSETAAGEQAYRLSTVPSISADGRYVVFDSWSFRLTGHPVDEERSVFLKAFPEVVMETVSPQLLPVGSTTTVTITGRYFLDGAILNIEDADIENLVIVDENTIVADITVAEGEAPGVRDLVVSLIGTGPGPAAATITQCGDCVTFF